MRAADASEDRRAALGRARQAQRAHEHAQHEWSLAGQSRKAAMARAIHDGLSFTEAGALFKVGRTYVSNVVAGRQGHGAR